MNRLREVLHRAGRAPTIDSYHSLPGVDRPEDYEGNAGWDWSRDYLAEVQQALIAVIEERGLGDSGWKSARWEVYDKVGLDPKFWWQSLLTLLSLHLYSVCRVHRRSAYL